MTSKTSLIILMILAGFYCLAQPAMELSEELEKRNGFKTIKLNNPVDSIPGVSYKKELMEKNEFPAKLYSIKDDAFGMIGEVKVNSIEVKTYKDLIYEIIVTTDKDQRLMKGIELALGKATYNVRTKAYHWAATSLSLTFIGNKNSITLIYKSYPVIKMMYADRGKKIERIAEDF